MMIHQLTNDSIFFISFGLISGCIIVAFVLCFSIYHNYNTNIKYETAKEKIEVNTTNSNLNNETDMP